MRHQKMIKISCVTSRSGKTATGYKESDCFLFDQYIWPCHIDAIVSLSADDSLPHAQCMVVYAGNTFQSTESMEDLVERVHQETEEMSK